MTAADVLAALVQALREEGEALAAGDIDRLAAIADRKEPLLQSLSADARAADLPRELVQQAKALNDRNALLLAPRLAATRARLEFLRQAGGAALYGANGQPVALSPGR
jgi:flagellar biosynthesis/type III secretory pathway chaperone